MQFSTNGDQVLIKLSKKELGTLRQAWMITSAMSTQCRKSALAAAALCSVIASESDEVACDHDEEHSSDEDRPAASGNSSKPKQQDALPVS